MKSPLFLNMITTLRQQEEIMLYDCVLNVSENEATEVVKFLQHEYQQEALNFPYEVPFFDENAALWAAKTVYIAAQLMLYRQHNEADLGILFPNFPIEITPSAVLSSDLCLRFLPSMIVHLKMIDSEDRLIEILENQLYQWHYSGVNCDLEVRKLDFKTVLSDKCLMQLYCNRIIKNKNTKLAQNAVFKGWIQANLGIYENDFLK